MADRDDTPDGFLSRWSRRKALVREGAPVVEPAPVAVVKDAPAAAPANAQSIRPVAPAPVVVDPSKAEPERPILTLDDVAQLTPESDFSAFAKRSVDPDVRNAAMKKLFTDPHYNVMDGLDTYIDDYNKSDPIPKSMLRQMVQARFLGLLDDELEEQPKPPPDVVLGPALDGSSDDPPPDSSPDPAADGAPTSSELPDSKTEPTAIDPSSPHENLDLQLQRHDANRQRGPNAPIDGQPGQRDGSPHKP
jgi:Protein of unknown function (DUF3306)